MRPALALLLTLAPSAGRSLALSPCPPPGPPPAPRATDSHSTTGSLPSEEARTLFLAYCAPCHGETGDGHGTTQLDRPARSFKDGGFSFGDTTEALTRTLKSGIPGSPMPSFTGTMTDTQLDSLAEYVLTLVPERRHVDASETVLAVADRPLVVRGLLPPISAEATAHARGLLIGMPEGLTFEWRTDDVRLLGVRQGAFVDRKDWIGRGGSPLEPLGRVVYLVDGGEAKAPFALKQGEEWLPLQARLAKSWVRGTDAGLGYRLEDSAGALIARVEDSAHALGTSVGSGFRRELRLVGGTRAGVLRFQGASQGGELMASFTSVPQDGQSAPMLWQVNALEGGLFQYAALRDTSPQATPGETPTLRGGGGASAWLDCSPGRRASVEISVIVTTVASDEVRATLEREVAR